MLNELKSLGLSDKEAKVYLASLELGSTTVQELARAARVNRPTAYVQIESLTKRGLMSSVTKGKKRFFQAESPDQLAHLIEKSKRELVSREDELAKILPELKNMFDSAEERPKVRFFEGKEGLKAMLNEFLKTKEKSAVTFFSWDDVRNVFSEKEVQAHRERREKKKIHTRAIYTRHSGPVASLPLLLEARHVDPQEYPMPSEFTIYGEKIAIVSLKRKLVGVVIENKEMANTFRSIFELAWRSSGKK